MTGIPNTKPLEDEECLMVLITAIDLGDRMRSVDEDEARKISESIALSGLDNAVSVREVPGEDGRFILVSGGHRIRAHQMLGLDYIRADIRRMDDAAAHSIERDENFFRSGLTVAQEAYAAGSFIEEWEAANGPIHWGRKPNSEGSDDKMQSLHLKNPFEELSEKAGKSKRSIQDLRHVYQHLGKDNLAALSDSPIADNMVQLKALSKLEPNQRQACVAALSEGAHKSVSDWRAAVGGQRSKEELSSKELWLQKMNKQWGEGKKGWKDEFLRGIGGQA